MSIFTDKYPLGLPRGSVRALLALGSWGLLAMALFFDVGENGLAVVAGLAGSSSTFYFNKRGQQDDMEMSNDA